MIETKAAVSAPSVPVVLSAAIPAQIPSAQTVPTSPAVPAHPAQAAAPVKTTVPAPPTPGATATRTPPPAPPTTTPTVVDPADPELTEAQLEKEVEVLWQDHKQAKHSARKTNKELALIRTDLARALYSLKNVLARPGCKGEWSSFLDSHSIARTTANRLVDVHQKSITPAASNCTTSATEEAMEDVVRRCVGRYWKKLSLVLTTPEAVEMFIDGLRGLAQKSFGADDEALDSSAPDGTAETI